MLSLKAELLRKEKEFQAKKKSQSADLDDLPRKKFRTSDKKEVKDNANVAKNKGVEERIRKDLEMNDEEVNKAKLSKAVLAAKAKLYEKLTSGEFIPEQNENSPFLVDFEQKTIDSWRETKEKSDKKTVNLTEEINRMVDKVNEEEMVEYEDALGRTRKCLKKDLHKYKKMDTDNDISGNKEATDPKDERTLMSDDMRREMERENWEQEAMEELDGPMRYAHLREGENRELGVGYYSFATNEEERENQLKMFKKMREETHNEQTEKRRIKNKKQQALQVKLEKMRLRKIKKLHEAGKEIPSELQKPINLDKSETKDQPNTDNAIDDPAEKVLVDFKNEELIRKFKVREWDKEKGSLWTPAESTKPPKGWQDPHDERLDEFAPPSFYYKGFKTSRQSSEFTEFCHGGLDSVQNKKSSPSHDEISQRTNRLLDEVEKASSSKSSDHRKHYSDDDEATFHEPDYEYNYKPVKPFSLKPKNT